jgi:hypothetical protein
MAPKCDLIVRDATLLSLRRYRVPGVIASALDGPLVVLFEQDRAHGGLPAAPQVCRSPSLGGNVSTAA